MRKTMGYLFSSHNTKISALAEIWFYRIIMGECYSDAYVIAFTIHLLFTFMVSQFLLHYFYYCKTRKHNSVVKNSNSFMSVLIGFYY